MNCFEFLSSGPALGQARPIIVQKELPESLQLEGLKMKVVDSDSGQPGTERGTA